jgi:hypothetical protein
MLQHIVPARSMTPANNSCEDMLKHKQLRINRSKAIAKIERVGKFMPL